MKKNIPTIKKSPLFQGIQDEDILSALRCLSPETRSYSKNEFVLHAGDSIDSVGLVLSGSVHVVNEDFWGNQNIIAEIGPGQVFAESYACMQGVTLGVSVFAAGAVTVLFLPVKNIMATCPTACAFHLRLIRNLVSVLAENNVRMNEKLKHVTQRSTREKLLSYLSAQSQKHASAAFHIPFNRQQLADYLAVNRSAMSAELCKMREEDVLEFDRNYFVLKINR